jgi:ribosome-binding factor A
MERINELIKRQLSSILLKEADLGHENFVTITDVQTAADLSACTVLVTITPDDAIPHMLSRLKSMAGFLQHELNGKVIIRKIPKIRFELDTAQKKADRIEELLEQIHKESPK